MRQHMPIHAIDKHAKTYNRQTSQYPNRQTTGNKGEFILDDKRDL